MQACMQGLIMVPRSHNTRTMQTLRRSREPVLVLRRLRRLNGRLTFFGGARPALVVDTRGVLKDVTGPYSCSCVWELVTNCWRQVKASAKWWWIVRVVNSAVELNFNISTIPSHKWQSSRCYVFWWLLKPNAHWLSDEYFLHFTKVCLSLIERARGTFVSTSCFLLDGKKSLNHGNRIFFVCFQEHAFASRARNSLLHSRNIL